MKRLISICSVLFLIAITGCDKKTCSNVQCTANQTCNSGNCYCRDGYEGANCDVLSATKFIRNGYQWTVSENCQNGGGGQTYYTSFQQPSSNISEVRFNFLGTYQISGYIRGATDGSGNNIEIPEQGYDGTNTVYGVGSYNATNKRITINFEYTYASQNKACTHTFY